MKNIINTTSTMNIPHYIVCEFLGGISFSSSERDVEIAEQIAGYTYSSMEELIKMCEGCIETQKNKKEFYQFIKQCQTNNYFKPYFKN